MRQARGQAEHVVTLLPNKEVSSISIPRLRRKTLTRLVRVFLAYVVIVFVFENMQLAMRYSDPITRFKFDFSAGNRSFFEATDLPRGNSSYEEDEEHHPVPQVDRTMLDGRGKPYVFQSLPANDAEKAYYRFKRDKINPFTYDYLINGTGVCDTSTTIIAVINSSPSNADKRAAIRETWGSLAHGGKWPHDKNIRGNLKLVFTFGIVPGWNEKLLAESKTYGDIVQGDFLDSYRNLTVKTLLGMRWVVDFCPNVTYYIKSDDDMIINVPYLLDILGNRPHLQRTIMGPLAPGSPVNRGGKWKLDTSVYPFKRYPPYEPGAAYAMTADIVGELFQAAEYFPQIFIDDVYITGILGRALGIYHARQSGFAFWGTRIPTGCDILLNKVITGHRCQGKRLRDTWAEMLRETEQTCRKKPPPAPAKKNSPPKKKTPPTVKEKPIEKNKAPPVVKEKPIEKNKAPPVAKETPIEKNKAPPVVKEKTIENKAKSEKPVENKAMNEQKKP